MTDVNRVNIIGRLTRDIASDERSFAYLPNGTARANVSIAVNRSRKNGDQWVDEVSYFDVTIWGQLNSGPYSCLWYRGEKVLQINVKDIVMPGMYQSIGDD